MDKYCNCTSSLTGYWGPKGNHNGRSSALFGANVRGISTDETYFSTTWKKGEQDYEKGNNNKKRNTSIDFFFFSSTGNYKLQLREKDYYFLGEHRLLFLSQSNLQKFTRKRDRNGEEIYICMYGAWWKFRRHFKVPVLFHFVYTIRVFARGNLLPPLRINCWRYHESTYGCLSMDKSGSNTPCIA